MKRPSLQAIPDWVEFDKVELFRLTCFRLLAAGVKPGRAPF